MDCAKSSSRRLARRLREKPEHRKHQGFSLQIVFCGVARCAADLRSGRLELWRNDTVGNLIDLFRMNLNNVSFVPYSMVAGDYGYLCTDSSCGVGHDSMVGTIHVVP